MHIDHTPSKVAVAFLFQAKNGNNYIEHLEMEIHQEIKAHKH